MVRDQGPSAISSDLWCAGETSSITPSCCPSSTSGIEEDKISVSSLSTLLYEAILVWSPSCGGQLSARGLHWCRVLWQGPGRCWYPWEGLCCRCTEGTCFPQNLFSHLVSSLEALGTSALDYISHIIPYLITFSTLHPIFQPFLSPPALSHPPASSLPLQPSLSAFLSALFASHHSTPQTAPFCRWTGPVTHGSPWGTGSQQVSRALFPLLSLGWSAAPGGSMGTGVVLGNWVQQHIPPEGFCLGARQTG